MSITGKAAANKITGKISPIDVIYIDAYKLAVSRGYEGTIDEWLASFGEGAVKYTKQDLTEEQKEQARENIGAVSIELFERTTGILEASVE